MVADLELLLVFSSKKIKKTERIDGTTAAKAVKQASAEAETRNRNARVSMELIRMMITMETRRRLTTVTMAPITMRAI